MRSIHGKTPEEWQAQCSAMNALVAMQPTCWFNPGVKKVAEALADVGLSRQDIEEAAARLKRFAPYFMAAFPETRKQGGILESPILAAPCLQAWLGRTHETTISGHMWLKLDSELPVSGSIKARGGIYEVLKHAEELALQAGLLRLSDNYAKIHSQEFRDFFSQYAIAVGSTGNLGLSIGIISATLGFKASVHMSAEARQWKKDTLRRHGVSVVEYASDYSLAVAMGRKEAENNPAMYFIDDENSQTLFLGYAVAALRLAGQLASFAITVDADHPLFVYLPCGVGGGPGGVAFGIKSIFGDNAHCIFCEPTHSPSMLLGVCTGLHSQVSVQDFGIDNKTAADGLACGRPSGFVGAAMQRLLDGVYTMDDDDMYRLLAKTVELEDVFMEPSSATSLMGPLWVMQGKEYLERMGLTAFQMDNAVHLSWITGGSMVPEDEARAYIEKGRQLLA